MADSTRLKEAANNLIAAARDFITQVETDEAAAQSVVPATAVNMPPETRAARAGEMQAQSAQLAAGAAATDVHGASGKKADKDDK